jgi:hypothetical protein
MAFAMDTAIDRRRRCSTSLGAIFGCWALAIPVVFADDSTLGNEAVVAVDERPADVQDRLVPVLRLLADNVVLGWKAGRLELDRHTLMCRFLGPDFERDQEVVRATVARVPQFLVDEAVAKGLARDRAERLFNQVGESIAPSHWRQNMVFDGGADDLAVYFIEPTAPSLLASAFQRTMDEATSQELVGPGGGMGSSGGSDPFSWYRRAGAFSAEGMITGSKAESTLSHEGRTLKVACTTEGGLTVRWATEGGLEGDGEETVRLFQTANQFLVRHQRDGEIVLILEGESFRDCCRANPAAVRRELVPLLRRIGIGPPAMPDDESVKEEVLSRLRKAAGVAERKAAAEAGESLEAGKHRLAQATAAIDAFGLLDDGEYLAALKPGAAAADVSAIDARLAKLAAPAAP